MLIDSKNVEESTTALVTEEAPDNKTRRYDRQLRLWAASGQSALESSRLLVISGTATSTSILKNLVLPGIGHFTILDPRKVTPEDSGNNFFLEGPSSIGKSRAEEAVRLLCELNDGVEGKADLRSLEEVLDNDKEWLTEFSLVIAHNLEGGLLDRLSKLLWEDESHPTLAIVRSSGFLAEFYIQYHEHTGESFICVIESHPETAQSLQIDKPFPALLRDSLALDFENMDVTDHGHIPYVYILVRVLEDWKKAHNGSPPSTYAERQEFKKLILAMRKKSDEENFEEAESQAYRAWTATTVPSEIRDLFSDPKDMKADTNKYIGLQKLYKKRAEEEKQIFKSYLTAPVDDATVDAFVKNAHALKLLRGKRWGSLDEDPKALAELVETSSKQLSTHLALSALTSLATKQQPNAPLTPTVEALTAEAQALLPAGVELPAEFGDAVGEVARAPNADLPNTAALLGGIVAQEVIKMITKQYIPIHGSCIIDLIETWTGILPV
ncbi:hypothetical protein NLJ89_g3399 [Agrocybe chaxingu]|uniref:NEDD8-activating enzyme E1 regulatory subunit n=1 Tax=Agrocybe chaxingu TaxID=84603 RepID=A0A9W8MVJ0_9AGAR|nr:hypothetical protein NLJ89_g3399 [Agrocybe chaxingu]